jgi:hypothetical protein
MRKTFNIEAFKSQINSSLANSTCTPDVRRGMLFALEHVLFEAGAYDGFRYLNQNEVVRDAQLPGVRVDAAGAVLPFETRFLDTDDTRRYYY